MKAIVIIGTSGHSKVVTEAVKWSAEYKIIGYIDDYRKSEAFGYPILGTLADVDKINEEFSPDGYFIAVGSNYNRYLIKKSLEDKKVDYVSVIHPSAIVSNTVQVPKGAYIGAGAIVSPGCYIGEHAIVNTGAVLEHDSILEEFASLSPRAVTGGNVYIGKYSFIGMNATIKNKVNIGEHTVIGAGAVVVNFISDGKVAYGVPCKEISDRKKDDKYL